MDVDDVDVDDVVDDVDKDVDDVDNTRDPRDPRDPRNPRNPMGGGDGAGADAGGGGPDMRSSEVVPVGEADKTCAPGKIFEDGSCIPLIVLVAMAEAYNAEGPEVPIKLYPSFETLNRSKYKKYLVREFGRRFSGVCTTQHCWTKQAFVARMKRNLQDDLHKKTFRPSGPQGKWEWLNTININDVVRQYENKYTDFKFLGAVPIDFDDLPVLKIRDLDLKALMASGKTKIGVVFNLDESYKSGSHWVAMYADLKAGRVYYFDSYGLPPEGRIRKFMRRVATFCQRDLSLVDVVAEHNKIRHQFGGSECGVYSINFILRLLRGDSFQQICESRVPDKVINQCRRVYFKPENQSSRAVSPSGRR